MNGNIRNFSIIAHIDHGKSTLADRFLELTNTIEQRKMKEQVLDSMDLERERGITIKMAPVRVEYKDYVLNLIDTPGHVDFSYEVSRALAAVEGALLVVDATQGVQAQTIANLNLALEQGLKIIPVINKIDVASADVAKVEKEISALLGDLDSKSVDSDQILKVSAKTGQGVSDILQALIERIPPPQGVSGAPLQALIFDSEYDTYQGVIAHVRVVNGSLRKHEKIYLVGSLQSADVLDIGVLRPQAQAVEELGAGEIGYIATGLKDITSVRVGDTVISEKLKMQSEKLKLPGYRQVRPVVFAGLYPAVAEEHEALREALEKISLNDASFTFVPERSDALGPGFRAGFLGLLHLDIIKERVKREHDLDIIVTSPSVEYKVKQRGKNDISVHRPQELPPAETIEQIEEPWVKLEIITPAEYLGNLLSLAQERRGEYQATRYLDKTRVVLDYEIPLSSIVTDFYDKLKGVSRGYASYFWSWARWQSAKIVRLDILIAEQKEEALAQLVYEPEAYQRARVIVERLKEVLPRQMFVVKIQAAIGSKVIAAERLSAMRKDVTAKLYGGDVTRKRKLLEKQKKGKKRMMVSGRVEIPSHVYLDILKH